MRVFPEENGGTERENSPPMRLSDKIDINPRIITGDKTMVKRYKSLPNVTVHKMWHPLGFFWRYGIASKL